MTEDLKKIIKQYIEKSPVYKNLVESGEDKKDAVDSILCQCEIECGENFYDGLRVIHRNRLAVKYCDGLKFFDFLTLEIDYYPDTICDDSDFPEKIVKMPWARKKLLKDVIDRCCDNRLYFKTFYHCRIDESIPPHKRISFDVIKTFETELYTFFWDQLFIKCIPCTLNDSSERCGKNLEDFVLAIRGVQKYYESKILVSPLVYSRITVGIYINNTYHPDLECFLKWVKEQEKNGKIKI